MARPPIQPGSYDYELAGKIASSGLSQGAMSRAADDLDALARIKSVMNDRRPQPEPKPKPFRHTHIFNPVGLDSWDPRPHPGSKAIPPGTPVRRVAQIGKGKLAFHHITDEAGNMQSVWKSSLTPKTPKRKS